MNDDVFSVGNGDVTANAPSDSAVSCSTTTSRQRGKKEEENKTKKQKKNQKKRKTKQEAGTKANAPSPASLFPTLPWLTLRKLRLSGLLAPPRTPQLIRTDGSLGPSTAHPIPGGYIPGYAGGCARTFSHSAPYETHLRATLFLFPPSSLVVRRPIRFDLSNFPPIALSAADLVLQQNG